MVLDNKNKMPCELLSYLHHRNPDDTENTFLNVHLILALTVRPQKMMTPQNRQVTWLSLDLLGFSVSLHHICCELRACKCAPWYREHGAASERGEFGNSANPEGRIHKKAFFFSCGKGIWLRNILSFCVNGTKDPKTQDPVKRIYCIYVLLAMISG